MAQRFWYKEMSNKNINWHKLYDHLAGFYGKDVCVRLVISTYRDEWEKHKFQK